MASLVTRWIILNKPNPCLFIRHCYFAATRRLVLYLIHAQHVEQGGLVVCDMWGFHQALHNILMCAVNLFYIFPCDTRG